MERAWWHRHGTLGERSPPLRGGCTVLAPSADVRSSDDRCYRVSAHTRNWFHFRVGIRWSHVRTSFSQALHLGSSEQQGQKSISLSFWIIFHQLTQTAPHLLASELAWTDWIFTNNFANRYSVTLFGSPNLKVEIRTGSWVLTRLSRLCLCLLFPWFGELA